MGGWMVARGAQTSAVRRRGYHFLVPIGKTLTQQEEKNDVSARERLSPS